MQILYTPLFIAIAILANTGHVSSSHTVFFPTDHYPDDHWAIRPKTFAKHPGLIAKVHYRGAVDIHHYDIYINPTDSRGYRSIITLTNPENPRSVLNRNYTHEERTALSHLTNLMTMVYESLGLVTQVERAGNNSQMLLEDGSIQMGTDKEPSMLHDHIIGRGNPEYSYVEGVPLKGPHLGEIFNMRGHLLGGKGNRTKVPWGGDHLKKVADTLRENLKIKKRDLEQQQCEQHYKKNTGELYRQPFTFTYDDPDAIPGGRSGVRNIRRNLLF